MRVVHLEAGTHLYGGALQVLLLVEGLQSRGVENVLVVPKGSALEEEARRRALPVHPLPLRGELDLAFLVRFRSLLLRERAHLLHLHSRRGADTLGAAAGRWAGIPVVLSRRVDNPEPSWAVAAKYRLYDAVVTISEAIRTVLLAQGVPPDKVRCVHSALDPLAYGSPCRDGDFRRKLGLPSGVPVVGMAAQFIPRKGHRVLLQALPRVLEEHPGTQVVLFGEGPLRQEMEAEVRRAGLEDTVHLPGFRDDFPELLPCLQVLVHPATLEGLGVVLLQASAAGVPVVASRAGGIPEAIVHGDTGVLVPPGDASALADALNALLADPERAAAMGREGRERVRTRFSPDAMVEGNLAVYREVLERRG